MCIHLEMLSYKDALARCIDPLLDESLDFQQHHEEYDCNNEDNNKDNEENNKNNNKNKEKRILLSGRPNSSYRDIAAGLVADSQIYRECIQYNTDLGECVKKYKNLIDGYFTKRNCWDQVKKYSNDYELIFTSLSKYPYLAQVSPPSRSYFKLWEILTLYSSVIIPGFMHSAEPQTNTVLTTAHVAEGPGGFIECIVDWVQRYHPDKQIRAHGMTLISPDKSVPQWKISKHKQSGGRVTFHTGVDKTGDLYNLKNIDQYITTIGEGSCCLVTGDGGFDIHGQFNSQEHMMHRLIAAEMYTALRLCKPGGCAVIKIFDCFTESTVRLLYIFQSCFGDMQLIKPLSSRPANSEKYIVCLKRTNCTPQSILTDLRTAIKTGDTSRLGMGYVGSKSMTEFVLRLIKFNTEFCFRQTFYICKTISFIDILAKKQREFIDDIVAHQYAICRDWCIRHDIQYKELPL